MYGLNALSLAFFFGLSIGGHALSRCGSRRRVLRVLCALLLCVNLLRYLLPPILGHGVRVAVEFSAVAYFAVPVILLSRRDGAQSWAAYSGLMAGFFYYLTMILLGGRIYAAQPPREVYLSLFCHGCLYLCGLVSVSTCDFRAGDERKLLLGVLLVAANALLLRPLTRCGERIFIYELMDAALLRQFLPARLLPAALPLYYLALTAAILLSIRGFFRLNRFQRKRLLAKFS